MEDSPIKLLVIVFFLAIMIWKSTRDKRERDLNRIEIERQIREDIESGRVARKDTQDHGKNLEEFLRGGRADRGGAAS